MWLDFFAHLNVARAVQLLDLVLSDSGKLSLIWWLTVVDVLDMLDLEQEGHVRV
jgi:hypothetical protein